MITKQIIGKIKKHRKTMIFFLPIAVLLAGLLIFLYHFTGGFSNEAKDWGSFGSYMSPFVTFATAIIASILSFLIYSYNNALNRPILSFKTIPINNSEVWQINNIGNGPALNIIVAHKAQRESEWIAPSVKCYSLGKAEKVDLDWMQGSVDVIGVYYTDFFDNKYVALVGDDITEVREYDSYKPIEINKFRYSKSYFDGLIQQRSVRIAMARASKVPENTALPSTTIQTTVKG